MSQDINIQNIRQNYDAKLLKEGNADKNPFQQFQLWFDEARAADFIEVNAMNIATVSKNGDVSSRMVLLKSFDQAGFVFFTNYVSHKANDIEATKQVALNFWWDKLHRQVRIKGNVEKISREESIEYFNTRPRGSQIGAAASAQSQVIADYAALENEYQRLEELYQDKEIPCPECWGGYRVVPILFEFWQGRANRLHDRLRYTKQSESDWRIERLSP